MDYSNFIGLSLKLLLKKIKNLYSCFPIDFLFLFGLNRSFIQSVGNIIKISAGLSKNLYQMLLFVFFGQRRF